MSREQAVLWLAEALMFLAGFCFLRGFLVRKTDLDTHRRMGKTGTAVVVSALLVLEVLMRFFDWEFPVRSSRALIAHIVVASFTLLVLATIVVTGVLRIRSVHVKLYVLFFPTYVATIVLSFLAFRLW